MKKLSLAGLLIYVAFHVVLFLLGQHYTNRHEAWSEDIRVEAESYTDLLFPDSYYQQKVLEHVRRADELAQKATSGLFRKVYPDFKRFAEADQALYDAEASLEKIRPNPQSNTERGDGNESL